MPNITDPRLVTEINRCWDLYLRGLLRDLVSQLGMARRCFEFAREEMGPRSTANADIELRMVEVITQMVTAEGREDSIKAADTLATEAADFRTPVETVCRVAAFAVGVHAAMRLTRLDLAEERFRQALAMSQGLAAEGGEDGVTMDDVSTLVGCAGLHLAITAASAGDTNTASALLDHSAKAAEAQGREHAYMGQYFGPQHVGAVGCIVLATLGQHQACVDSARAVDLAALYPLVRVNLLRAVADCHERIEQPAVAAALRARADALAPPLRRQFGLDTEAPQSGG
ncbi:MAG TPA: hypothetical protein VFO60_06700 [Candidatus Dormibacteraeota bacterium]|nr:hypothetical protein [Candidatus Dormibacteraeota bacterium]